MNRRTYAAAIVTAAATLIPATSARADSPPERITEAGMVASCSGSVGDLEAGAELYQNSSAPDSLNVFIAGPEGLRSSSRDNPEPVGLFTDGTISGESALLLRGEEASTPAGTATVSGSYAVAGSPTRVHTVVRDDGFIIVSTGTNTPLTATVSVTYDGTTFALTCDPAFAFDLTTLRQRIGNS